jgi:hypothetical protein
MVNDADDGLVNDQKMGRQNRSPTPPLVFETTFSASNFELEI